MRRGLCMLLIVVLVCAMLPIGVFATNSVEYRKSNLPVVVDKDGKATEMLVPVVIKNDEIYMKPEDLPQITRYGFSADSKRLIFQLGLKSVVVDTQAQTLQVNFTQQAFSGCLEVDDIHYLPMSELLPWLNVQCYVADGKLHLDSDQKSYWEVIADFNSTDYLFDLAENYGQTTGDVVGLCAISVFDCILDLDNIWKKVVTVGDGDTRLYDYEIYKECFREFALPETGTEAELQKMISELSGVVSDSSQFTNTCFETLYNEEMHGKLAERFGKDFAEGFDELPTDAAQLSETLKLAKTALKYVKTGYLYTRITMTDTTDYANALRHIYLKEDRAIPGGIELAASEAIVALKSQAGAVTDAAVTVFADVGITLLEKTAKSATEDAIKAAAGDTILGSLGLYLDIVDTALTLVWPVNDAYSEITKMTVYQSIQYDALNAFYDLSKNNTSMNASDISNGRLSAIIFLKTAKKCYQAQQDTFDLFGGDGVLEYQINDINSKLLEFELSALAEERDAIEDKSTEMEALKQLWNDGGFIKENSASDTTALLGTWYLYQGGKQDAKGHWSDLDAYTIKLLDGGDAEFSAGWVDGCYYTGYTGTWSAVSSGIDQFQVQLNVTGGDLMLGETLPKYDCSLLVEVTIKNNILTVKKISGDDICLIYGKEYERDLSDETWKERQLQKLSSSMPDSSYLGKWHYQYYPDSGAWDRTLTINSIEGKRIRFDLSYYRIADFTEQIATINADGTASFTATEGNHSISGIIAFGDSVTVYITSSYHPYVDADLKEYTGEEKEVHPQNTKVPNGEASVINGEKDETDRLFSTGYPEVIIGDAVFAADSSGVYVFTGEHKETIYAGNLLFGKNICTDGQTVYAIDSGNNIIEIDVYSRNAKTLFNLSGDIDIEGVSNGKIYMSYLSNEESAGIAAGGDFVGYDLNIYDFDGYQIGEIESGGTMEMTAGLLVVEEPAPLGSDFPCKIYRGEELLLDEYNVCDVMAVSGKVYYLLPGESSDSVEIHKIDQAGDHTIATLNVSNANGYGFYKHDAGVYSGLVATGGRLVWTADHYYDITSGNEVLESTIIPSVEEAWGFVVEDEYTHQRYYVSYSEYGTDGTMTIYSYSSNNWVTVSQVQHASFVCIYKSTLYYSKQQTTEGSTIATIAAESIK